MDADTPLFGELLETELSHYESLKSLLQQERELLVNREIEEFTVLLSRKHVLLSKLEEDNQARCQLRRNTHLKSDIGRSRHKPRPLAKAK